MNVFGVYVSASDLLTWGLCGFFLIGAISNLSGLTPVRTGYARWGYPPWFNYVTGLLELSASALCFIGLRLEGLAVGFLVMAAASITLLRAKEYAHAVPGAVVIVLIVVAGITGTRA